jgi:membrane protease YdiL (CAAX protease family)
MEKPSLLDRLRPNVIWIIFVTLGWYMFIAAFGHLAWESLMEAIKGSVSPAMFFTLDLYAATIVDILTLFILCWLFTKNRYIWKSFLIKRGGPDYAAGDLLTEDDTYADLYGRRRNGFKMLGMGLLLGFLTNFFCIACALLHGDIKLYFDCAASQIPYFLFSLFCVCIQSSAEELWCRGFMYERLHERYPLWFAIAVNGVLFGLLHIFNPGVSVIPIVGIIITGISYSLLRWYSGNIWIAMGIHTDWNFTQNYLFGLPNSGLVSEASVFHLDAANGMTNLIYDWDFGVEGGLPALFIDGFIAVVIIYLACRNGKIKELGMNRFKTLEAHGLKMRVEEAAPVTPVNVEPVDSDSKSDIKEAAPAETVVEEYTEE